VIGLHITVSFQTGLTMIRYHNRVKTRDDSEDDGHYWVKPLSDNKSMILTVGSVTFNLEVTFISYFFVDILTACENSH